MSLQKSKKLLLVSSFGVMFVAFLNNLILTKVTSRSGLGDYVFVLNLFLFLQIIFNFGIFYTLSKLMSSANDEYQMRRLYGVGLFFVFIFWGVMSFGLAFYVCVSDVFSENVRQGIMYLLPLSFVFILGSYSENLLQGSGRLDLLSIYRFFPKFLFCINLGLIYFCLVDIDAVMLLLLNVVTILVPVFYIVIKLRPTFDGWMQLSQEVLMVNKSFGLNVYIGAVVSVGASSSTGLLIGLLGEGNGDVAAYSLALQLASPLMLLPSVLGTSYFREFALSQGIERKLLYIVYLLGAVAIFVVFFISDFFVDLIFGVGYHDVAVLWRVLTVGTVLYGIADIYNKFLFTKGLSLFLRNTSFFIGFVIVIGNITLIPLLGTIGAAVTYAIAGLCFFCAVIIGYCKVIKRI